MHPYRRADRVGPLIQREIARMLERGEIHDPRLQKITITKVSVTDDLKISRVFFSLIGTGDEIKQAMEGLKSAKGLIRKAIADNIYLRHTPDLEFFHDHGLEYSQRVDDLIKKIRESEPGTDKDDPSKNK